MPLTDESYIQLAIEIAKKGMGNVSPNPLVGCVIVKNNKIIGAGYHEQYGKNHAEINAINSSIENIEGSTLYVNLEPCSHYGKTPPCVQRIIERKVKRVVIGTRDMNPLVSGNGIKALKKAGIEVKVGILEKECVDLNKFFFKYITKKTPYVTLKIAQTLDGKIADQNRDSKWITSLSSRRYVHTLRSKYDAVLIGSKTVEKDNPNLTVRLVEGRNPKRIIADTRLSLKLDYKIFSGNADRNLIVLTSEKSISKERKIKRLQNIGAKILFIKENENGLIDLKAALKELGKQKINSLLVEGGGKMFTSLIKDGLYDNILLFIAPKILGAGLPAVDNIGNKTVKQALKVEIKRIEQNGDDLMVELVK